MLEGGHQPATRMGGRLRRPRPAGGAAVRRCHGIACAAQVSFHEVAGGSRRLLRAAELYLFELQLVEQAADRPGFDDPVHLYGTLLGPLSPAGLGEVTEGQLTVTRADLLEGAGARRRARVPLRRPRRGHGRAGVQPAAARRSRRGADPGARGGARLPGAVGRPAVVGAGQRVLLQPDPVRRDHRRVERRRARGAAAAPPARRTCPCRTGRWPSSCWSTRATSSRGTAPCARARACWDRCWAPSSRIAGACPPRAAATITCALAEEALGAVAGLAGAARPGVARLSGRRARVAAAAQVRAATGDRRPALPPPPPPPPRHRAGPPHWMVDFITSHQQPGRRPPVVTGAGRGPRSPDGQAFAAGLDERLRILSRAR